MILFVSEGGAGDGGYLSPFGLLEQAQPQPGDLVLCQGHVGSLPAWNGVTVDAYGAGYSLDPVYIMAHTKDLALKNGRIAHAPGHGMAFENAEGLTIEGFTIEDCGGQMFLADGRAYGNGIQIGHNCRHVTVRRNVIRRIFDSGISPQSYKDNGWLANVQLEENDLSECGMAGIEISSTAGNRGILDGITLTNNAIRACAKDVVVWSKAGAEYWIKAHVDRHRCEIFGNVQVTTS